MAVSMFVRLLIRVMEYMRQLIVFNFVCLRVPSSLELGLYSVIPREFVFSTVEMIVLMGRFAVC